MNRVLRMKDRLQRGIMLSLFVVLFVSYIVTVAIIYKQNFSIMQYEVNQEAKYIKNAVDIAGIDYLKKIDNVDRDTRITRIDTSGRVLYDSQGIKDLDNHLSRKEVKMALKTGKGEDKRTSPTLGKDMYYYALLLDDGTVIRVSKTIDNMTSIALDILPIMGGIFVFMVALSGFIAIWQTRKIVGPINDIDLEKPLENATYQELQPLLNSIDEQNREKDAIANMRKEFSANVSHELKTPLTSISGYAEIMKNGMVRPQDMVDFSKRIYDEASRLIKLVNDIINISILDEGYANIDREDVDLYDLCNQIISRLSSQANKRNIKLSIEGERVDYYGIRPILDEMVYNICENAIKYNKDGGSVKVWVGDTLDGPKIFFTDTGIGMEKGELNRIFERFYRIDKSHSKLIGGTGLGLSIVKHAAILHGANVSVESELGKGTKFEIAFGRNN